MSTLPKPVSPVSQVQAYQNRALSGIGQGQITAAPIVQMPSSSPQAGGPIAMPTVGGRTSMISEGASNAHATRLAALQRQARPQAPSFGGGGGGGLTVPNGPGGSGPRTGIYGLTQQAGNSLGALQQAYQARFGQALTVNSGGRSYEDQVRAYQNYLNGGNLAAKPGTSIHERGNAVDFGGPLQSSGSPQHQWLVANAGRYGWTWAGKNFSQVEPWHFEYRG